jgi:hypothetical protein
MKQSLAGVSLVLFGVSVVFLLVWTLFESRLVGMSTSAERIITFALLVLPAGVGAVIGLMSLMQKEGQRWLAVAGILLNTLFALFHTLIVLFAG